MSLELIGEELFELGDFATELKHQQIFRLKIALYAYEDAQFNDYKNETVGLLWDTVFNLESMAKKSKSTKSFIIKIPQP